MVQINKETTAEQKGANFLEWVANNQNELKKAVKKNITYDPDIFDDVWSEAIINVYNTIVKNNQEIANIKNYFFLACKWQYQMRQNQSRKRKENAVRDNWQHLTIIDDGEDEDARENDIIDALRQIREALNEQYGETSAEMFLFYWEGKSRNDMNYQTVADKYGLTLTAVKRMTQEMKNYVITELPYIKEIFRTDYAHNQ